MQTAQQLDEQHPSTHIYLHEAHHEVQEICAEKVVDLSKVRQRVNPNRYAKGKDRERLLVEINQLMVRGIPVHEIAGQYSVNVSTAYNWVNEVKAIRAQEMESIDMEPLVSAVFADIQERVRLLYKIVDSPNSTPNERIKAIAELRQTVQSKVELFRETKAFKCLMEELTRQKCQSEKSAEEIKDMLSFFMNGLDAELSGGSVADIADSSDDTAPIHSELLG